MRLQEVARQRTALLEALAQPGSAVTPVDASQVTRTPLSPLTSTPLPLWWRARPSLPSTGCRSDQQCFPQGGRLIVQNLWRRSPRCDPILICAHAAGLDPAVQLALHTAVPAAQRGGDQR
ncbi:hypothetical protein OAO87_00535 [bacterium]|nr:hypothetical protein [bacterium]